MIRCASCGSYNPDENNFCDQCGAKLINTPSNTESVKYANNPFESSNSSSSKEFNNPFGDNSKTEQSKRIDKPELEYGETIKKCSRCSGTGKIKEKVPSMFGETYEYKTCPKCHGIGKYIVDENGKHRDIISDSSIKSSEPAPKTDYSNQNKATKQVNYKLIIALVGGILGYIVLFNILGSFGDKNKDKKSSASVSASSSTTTETSSKSTHETLSDSETATVYYNDLSFDLPGDWIEIPLYDDLVFRYGEKPGPDCSLLGYDYLYEDDPVDFADARENLINNFNYDVENGDYISFEYEDMYIGDRQAIKLIYQGEYRLYIEVYVDTGDGYIIFSFSIVNDCIDEFKPVVEGIIDSIKVVEPTSESTSSSSPDIEFTSYTYKDLTCEIPAGWVESTGDSNTDTINIYDNPDSAKYAIGFGFLEGDLSLSNEEVKAGLISANDGIYDVYENEDCKVGNHTAVKLTCINDEFVLIQYLIDADEGIVSIGFGYNSSDEAAFEPIMDYILNSCSFETVEATTISETTEPTEEIVLDIDISPISFRGITVDVPDNWLVYDLTFSNGEDYGQSYEYVNYIYFADSSDENCGLKLFFGSDIDSSIEAREDSILSFCETTYDSFEYEYTTVDKADALKITGLKDNIKTIKYYIDDGGRSVDISFFYYVDQEDEYKPIFDYIMYNFKLE